MLDQIINELFLALQLLFLQLILGLQFRILILDSMELRLHHQKFVIQILKLATIAREAIHDARSPVPVVPRPLIDRHVAIDAPLPDLDE